MLISIYFLYNIIFTSFNNNSDRKKLQKHKDIPLNNNNNNSKDDTFYNNDDTSTCCQFRFLIQYCKYLNIKHYC